jgi:hypothetical protein
MPMYILERIGNRFDLNGITDSLAEGCVCYIHFKMTSNQFVLKEKYFYGISFIPTHFKVVGLIDIDSIKQRANQAKASHLRLYFLIQMVIVLS